MGQIKFNRNPEFELPGVEQPDFKKKNKGEKQEDEEEDDYHNICCKMFSKLYKDLEDIKNFIIMGSPNEFKGLLSYAFEGLEEEPAQDS